VSDSKSIQEINQKIEAGTVKVGTDVELWRQLREGAEPSSIDLDVLITAFSSSMRGCAAMLLIPVSERSKFTRARKIWLNGVEGHPGPAPNERLGVVDTLIFADRRIEGDSGRLPAGTKLLLDLLEGSEIQVKCLSEEGGVFHNQCKIKDLEFARMVTYNTFVPEWLSKLFGSRPGGASAVVPAGTKMLLNGSTGIVVGSGTRGRAGHESFSLSASMFEMNRKNIGRGGDDATISVAIPIAVVNEETRFGICSSLLTHRNPEFSNPIDADAASYLKGLVAEGHFRLTEAPFE
jgi:uncharacterized protein (DUF39 family)